MTIMKNWIGAKDTDAEGVQGINGWVKTQPYQPAILLGFIWPG
jgi:hypothetical protein